jgi:hypothetical protein
VRQPVNPIAGARQRTTSAPVALTVDVYDTQPYVVPPDTVASVPIGQWKVTGGSFTDDATAMTARTMTLTADSVPAYVLPGKWLQVTIGYQVIEPVLYRLPAMVVEDIVSPLDANGGVTVELADASAVVNGRPYEYDRTIAPDHLQTFVKSTMDYALSRPVHNDDVPYVLLPVGAIAEFGEGRWDVCVRMAEACGYSLRLNDMGDPVARLRTDPPPAPVGQLEQSLLPGGTRHHVRTPTASRVLVTRGTNLPPMIGKATTVNTPPGWYRPVVVTDRQQGPDWWNQGYADSAAEAFLNRALSELDRYDDLPVLASPWLEAGFDTVTFYGVTYWVSKLTMGLPDLATTMSLTRTVP